jgi:hypothetical protein
MGKSSADPDDGDRYPTRRLKKGKLEGFEGYLISAWEERLLGLD